MYLTSNSKKFIWNSTLPTNEPKTKEKQENYKFYSQIPLKAPVLAWSPNLSNDDPVWYLDGWLLKWLLHLL